MPKDTIFYRTVNMNCFYNDKIFPKFATVLRKLTFFNGMDL